MTNVRPTDTQALIVAGQRATDTGVNPTRPGLRDPEHLNEAIRVTSRSTWILLTSLALCVAGFITWGFLGRLDFSAGGPGVLLRSRSEVADVVARADGTVASIHVAPGQQVAAGDVLVSVTLSDLKAQRDLAKSALDAQRQEYAKYESASVADITRRKADVEIQTTTLQADIAEASNNRRLLRQIYSDYVTNWQQGLATRPQLQAALSRLDSVQQSVRQMTDRLMTLSTEEIEFENEVSRNLLDLKIRLIAAESRYRDLQVQFEIGSTIRSPVAGTVTEITTQINATVTTGEHLAVVESNTSARTLIAHAYLPIDQGKRVLSGMPAEISPTSIDEDIYGSIRGVVLRVSPLPISRAGLIAVLGDSSLVNMMTRAGAPIDVEIALQTDPHSEDGLSWTSATRPPTPITPGTTVAAKIVVDRLRPVSLILPSVVTWTHL